MLTLFWTFPEKKLIEKNSSDIKSFCNNFFGVVSLKCESGRIDKNIELSIESKGPIDYFYNDSFRILLKVKAIGN